jgi:hypothetical protein
MIGKIGYKQIERICLVGLCLFLTRSYQTLGCNCFYRQAEVEKPNHVIQTDPTAFPKIVLRSQHNIRVFTRLELNAFRKLFNPALLLEQDSSDPLITVQVVGVSRPSGFDSTTVHTSFSRAPPGDNPEMPPA